MQKILVGYECLQCFIHQIDRILNLLDLEEDKKKTLFLKSISYFSTIEDFNFPPPEIARQLYRFLYSLLKDDDPFKTIKQQSNLVAEEILSELSKSEFQLKDFVKFSVGGNVIDFGVKGSSNKNIQFEYLLDTVKYLELTVDNFNIFQDLLDKSSSLLYILDNSGEVIFDKKLLYEIKELYPRLNIFIAARNSNIINDISLSDAFALGMGSLGEVVSTGYDGPGVMLNQASTQFINIYNSVDIIISKGQGNFETLWGEDSFDKNIFFALKVKCPHISSAIGYPLNSNLFLYGKKLNH